MCKMEHNFLYEAISKRKSIRKYDPTPLDEEILAKISEYLVNVKTLFPDIKTEMRIYKQEEVKTIMPIKAPHYMLFFSEVKEGYLTNAGFMIQQVDLFLSSNGIGSCYLGMAKPTKEVKKSTELEYIMMLAFGDPAEPVYRANISEFTRNTLPQISSNADNDDILEAARLAPSATNNQPWFFTGNSDIINVYCAKHNAIKAIMYEKLNKLDMGIALCHIAVAAEHFGKEITFEYSSTTQNRILNGYYFITKINLKQSTKF